MSRAEILQGILNILKRYEGRAANRSPLTEATSLAGELDIDSPRMVDIVLDVEGKFNIRTDDSQSSELKTIGEIVDMVQNLVNAAK